MLLPRVSSSSAILVLRWPIMHMLLVEAPLFFFGTQLSLLSYLPVLPSRLLNFLLSPSNFSILNSPFSMSTVLLPPLKNASICLSLFLSEINTSISLAATTPHEFLNTGDLNFHLHDSQVKRFLGALDSTNHTQHVSVSTHRDHHILDLVITPTSSSLNPVFDHSPVSPSDHWSLIYILFSFNIAKYSFTFNSNFLSQLQIYQCF